ncbi:dynein heavy chain, partial [Coemansia sp. RSA 2603]
VYGGRLDNDSDRRVLRSFVDRLFTADAFAADFALVPGAGAGAEPLVAAPADATKPAEFAQWCAALPEREPPAWLGLPGSAETLLLVHAGEQLLADVRRLRALMDDDDDEADDEEGGDDEDRGAMHVCETDDAADSDGALPALPAYMRQAAQQAATFAAQLPASLDELPPLASDEPASPLRRVLARENLEARRLLARVQGDLAHLRAVSTGARLTNELRQLLADFGAGRVPAAWRAYTVRSGVTLARWVADFAARLAHGRELAEHLGDPEFAVWLGGLMFPEAFITATRQAAAQQMGCALEELHVNLALQ